jgi:hypothetical protein
MENGYEVELIYLNNNESKWQYNNNIIIDMIEQECMWEHCYKCWNNINNIWE